MQKGSLIMLAKPLSKKDYELADVLGTQLPNKDVCYTVCTEPSLMYCHIQRKRVPLIQLEELDGFYDPAYFVEVQGPMKIDLNEILIS